MRRVMGIIMALLGLGMITAGVLAWDPLVDRAWEFGGMAATAGFFLLLFGGGAAFVIIAGIWLRYPKQLDPYEGYRVNGPELGGDDYYDDENL